MILSFDKVFHGITKDTNLINKLTIPDELSGLLNLALIALRQLKKDGGFRDISVEKVRKEYEYNANTVKAFLDDKCVIDLTSPEYCIPTVYLYNEYENFCQKKGVTSTRDEYIWIKTKRMWNRKRSQEKSWRQRVLLFWCNSSIRFARLKPISF